MFVRFYYVFGDKGKHFSLVEVVLTKKEALFAGGWAFVWKFDRLCFDVRKDNEIFLDSCGRFAYTLQEKRALNEQKSAVLAEFSASTAENSASTADFRGMGG